MNKDNNIEDLILNNPIEIISKGKRVNKIVIGKAGKCRKTMVVHNEHGEKKIITYEYPIATPVIMRNKK